MWIWPRGQRAAHIARTPRKNTTSYSQCVMLFRYYYHWVLPLLRWVALAQHVCARVQSNKLAARRVWKLEPAQLDSLQRRRGNLFLVGHYCYYSNRGWLPSQKINIQVKSAKSFWFSIWFCCDGEIAPQKAIKSIFFRLHVLQFFWNGIFQSGFSSRNGIQVEVTLMNTLKCVRSGS
jgi:hypothetical protein